MLEWEEWQPFLQPYLAGRTVQDPGLPRRMHLYLALYPLAWLGWLLSAGVTRAKGGELQQWMIHEMAPNQKLRRYLVRATAWPNPDFGNERETLVDVVFFPEA